MGREALAEAMIPVIGRLYRENNVVTSIHGRSLINKSTMNILKAHRFARRMSKDELLLEETAPLLDIIPAKLETSLNAWGGGFGDG
jgi:glyceraldehyde 3-phosphate dehydrogenase